jgi:peptide/nickel transport system ATP-binding protein
MPRFDRARSERLTPIKGTPPSLINLPSGCPFHPRCLYVEKTDGRATSERPVLADNGAGSGHYVACHLSPDLRREIWTEQIQPKL